MGARQTFTTFLALILFVTTSGFAGAADPPPPPPGAPPAPPTARSWEATPARLSYLNGEVGFWRPDAGEWAQAELNTPLASGDALSTGTAGSVEIQVGPRAFVRAAENTQIGLDGQEPGFLRLRLTAGHAALDFRELTGQTVELQTPNGIFAVERAGYYHVQVSTDSAAFAVLRGGSATLTPADGGPLAVAANQQVVIIGVDSPRIRVGVAPEPGAWDRWNDARTDSLLRAASARYLGPDVYGADALDRYGSWQTVDTYGSVWVPSGVPTGWVPYSAGRWIWDPRFGWTWLDDAPWGWAPYHYGRWVFVGGYWAWAPGPIVVRPAYSPALVVFLGGGVSAGRPLCWAPLGWGEPLVPWWGRAGFVGVPTWRGWGGPHVVNNVMVNRTTTVRAANIDVYSNVHVASAVVGLPADRFGRGHERPQRFTPAQARQLTPWRGTLDVRPAAAAPSSREPERRATRTTPTPPRIAPFDRAAAPGPASRGSGTPAAAPSTAAPSVVTPPVAIPKQVERERRQPDRVRDERQNDRRTEGPRSQIPAPSARPAQAPAPAPDPRVQMPRPMAPAAPVAPERRDVPAVRSDAPPARQAERAAIVAPSAPSARAVRVAPATRVTTPTLPTPAAARAMPRQDGGQPREREQHPSRSQGH